MCRLASTSLAAYLELHIAQGGVLVIDDLGRQKVSPKEILNRWVIMMEQGYDSFALSSSEIVRLPLDVTLVFSTNLTLRDLMDEAYLRRIAYKIAIPDAGAACRDHAALLHGTRSSVDRGRYPVPDGQAVRPGTASAARLLRA